MEDQASYKMKAPRELAAHPRAIPGDRQTSVDFGRCEEQTEPRLAPVEEEEINDMFDYHPWSPEQIEAGGKVRAALAAAFKAVRLYTPKGPDQSTALRKIREARMDANSAITHGGKY